VALPNNSIFVIPTIYINGSLFFRVNYFELSRSNNVLLNKANAVFVSLKF